MWEFLIWFFIGIFIIFSAFFSGSETVLISFDKDIFKKKAKKGDSKANKVTKFIKKPDLFLSTILVGNNICIVSVSVLFQEEMSKLTNLTGFTLSIITTIIVSFFMLIFAEIVPKTLGLVYSNRLSYIATQFIKTIYYIFYPVILFVRGISSFIEKFFKFKNVKRGVSFFSHKGELRKFVRQTHLIKDLESGYINNILKYSETTAKEIMTPLLDVELFNKDGDINDLIKIIKKSQYSKIPIFKDRINNLVGYVNTIDLAYYDSINSIETLIKEPYNIPETKKLSSILMEMQRRKVAMAFVIDEFGSTSGIITHEDIAEEIVGDILMEKEKENIIILNKGNIIEVDSMVDVDILNEKFGLGIEKKGFERISGFVMFSLGHIPKSGESFIFNNHKYSVIDADEKSINRVLITNLDSENIG